jgi:PKD repeat protein
VSKSWDFSNDGITDSAKMNPVYEFVTQGNYTVNLTVKNVNGANSKLATINVLTKSNSSGGSSGRDFGGISEISGISGNSHKSGGIGGVSPETVRNVQVKELFQAFITSGKLVKFDFTKNAAYVVYVSFQYFFIKKVKMQNPKLV